MARTILSAALAAFVLASACPVAAQEAGGGAARKVAQGRLPVLGTVGDLPPKAECVEIEVTPEPRLLVGGRQMDLAGLQQELAMRSTGRREETGAKASMLYAVLRVDRDVRWQDVQWLLQACCDPAVRVHKVLFAAVPEDGGEEGAMALFLPTDVGVAGSGGPGVAPAFPVRLRAAPVSSADPGHTVWARLPRDAAGAFVAAGRRAVLDADPDVATGAVLEVVDALLRAGVRGITLRGTSAKAADASAPRGGEAVARPEVVIQQTVAEPPVIGEPSAPRIARVRGALAGQAVSPSAPAAQVTVEETDPEDEEEPGEPKMFGGRRRGKMNPLASANGTMDATGFGLEWLQNHQSAGGYWDCDGFESMCKRNKCGNPGGPLFDSGVTGLALLAFLGYGETHKTTRYGHVVRNGLKYLKGGQDPDGCFGGRTSSHFTYNHAIAALAMTEAYALTQSPLFKSSAQNGINFVLQCRNPYLAWRYGVRPQDNDTSVTGWMVMALRSAAGSDLLVDPEAFKGAKAWLDKVTEPEYGRAGYTARGNGPCRPKELIDRFPTDRSESLTAVAVLTRIFCGAKRDDPMVWKGVELLTHLPPRWDEAAGTIDFYYWYYGTLAMFQVGGEPWKKWNEAMTEAIVKTQVLDRDDDRFGSWDALDPWARDGGRVYGTAVNVMSLEVYYRYARVFPR